MNELSHRESDILHSWLIVQRYGGGNTGQNFTGIPIKQKEQKRENE